MSKNITLLAPIKQRQIFPKRHQNDRTHCNYPNINRTLVSGVYSLSNYNTNILKDYIYHNYFLEHFKFGNLFIW